MKESCLNYKFFLLMFLPVFLLFVGNVALLESHVAKAEVYISVLLIVLPVVFVILLLILEPIRYNINKDGIVIFYAFRKRHFLWEQIMRIETHYDVRFEHLLIKDYHLIFTSKSKINENLRIVKTRKTTALIQQYSGLHINL